LESENSSDLSGPVTVDRDHLDLVEFGVPFHLVRLLTEALTTVLLFTVQERGSTLALPI
jgi:hypothetical protein